MSENEAGEQVMNEETMREITCYAEPRVAEAEAGERFQFFRHGYFVADSKLHSKEEPVFNEIVGLKSSWKQNIKSYGQAVLAGHMTFLYSRKGKGESEKR